MSKHDIIARFCALSKKVMERQFKCHEAADCFCGENNLAGVWDEYQFSENIISFIETAVEKALPVKVEEGAR